MQPGILNHFPPAPGEILRSNEKSSSSHDYPGNKIERIDCLRKQISVLKCEFSNRNLRLTFYGSIQSKHALIASYLSALLGFPRLKFYSYDNLFSLSLVSFSLLLKKSNCLIWKYSSVELVRPVCVLENLSSAAKGGRNKIVKNLINISEFFVKRIWRTKSHDISENSLQSKAGISLDVRKYFENEF